MLDRERRQPQLRLACATDEVRRSASMRGQSPRIRFEVGMLVPASGIPGPRARGSRALARRRRDLGVLPRQAVGVALAVLATAVLACSPRGEQRIE